MLGLRSLISTTTLLIYSHTCFNTRIQEVNIQLHNFSTWFNTNKLSLNTKKKQVIIFTPNMENYNISEVEINIDGRKSKHVKCTTFLGITIDEHLDWNVHIDNLSNKIARNVGMLNKLKHFISVYMCISRFLATIVSRPCYSQLTKILTLICKLYKLLWKNHYMGIVCT